MPTPLSDVNRPLPPFDRPVALAAPPKFPGSLRAVFVGIAVAVAAGCSGGAGMVPAGIAGGHGAENISRALPATSPTPAPASGVGCILGSKKDAGCDVKKNPDYPPSKTPAAGLTAAQLRHAYGLKPASSSAIANGPLVAVVDAFDNKDAENDLATYRAQFGLPACTSKNGCFTKIFGGGTRISPGQLKKILDPTAATTWSDEIALDLAMVSASCPTCRILLVEAYGQDLDSLAASVNVAASYRPVSISNSWGVPEGGNIANIDAGARAAFDHPGIAITASAGDSGQVQFPASSPSVTAVGGTTLTASASTTRGWTEAAWAPSGTGCSAMYAAPAWQTAVAGCSGRAIADVSLIADYTPGVAVYSSAQGGWVVLGGTSVGAPFIAGLYGAANDYGVATRGAPKLYAAATTLNAVTGAQQGSPKGLAGF